MKYWYNIAANYDIIPKDLIDGDSKIIWDKLDNSLVYKKRLDGTFIMNRAKNEVLYDAIMNMSFGFYFYIQAINRYNKVLAQAIFRKYDIEYSLDKCQIKFKPIFYETLYACIAKNGDKDYNIISYLTPIHTINYSYGSAFEFKSCSESNVKVPTSYWDGNEWQRVSNAQGFPNIRIFCDEMANGEIQQTDAVWTFYSQVNLNPVAYTEPWSLNRTGYYFDIKTTWFREVKYVPITDDNETGTKPPQGSSTYDWVFVGNISIGTNSYHKWVRCVDNLVIQGVTQILPPSESYITWSLSSWFGQTTKRVISRTRKLTDILNYFATECGCTLKSEFFTNNVNPLSGADLTNLLIAQKSDCIFETPFILENSDPATIGNITFNSLMANLWAMFQVTWYISPNFELVVEHINYFRNNLSYMLNTTVGINLQAVYPLCLDNSNTYTYTAELPIREKFNFMEAWNIDFRGVDIEYTNTLVEGNTDSYSADRFTTDIDPLYLDNEASKDGFCMFHCDPDGNVIKEIGRLSGLEIENGHLSFANLHYAYWRYNRYLSNGLMNNVITPFFMNRKLKNQVAIQFPYCVDDFDPNLLIQTDMGKGEVKTAEYSFKTGNIKVELIYE